MLKLMGKLLKRNVAVESVAVLRKKIKSIKNVYRQELTKTAKSPPPKKKLEQELTKFINLNSHGFFFSSFHPVVLLITCLLCPSTQLYYNYTLIQVVFLSTDYMFQSSM
jgi:hypothetical protein